MAETKLTLVYGGKGDSKKVVGVEKKPLNERMTWADRIRRRIYSAISSAPSDWLSFDLKLWALNGLNALHVKYDSATGHK